MKYWTPSLSEAKKFLTYSFETHPMNENIVINFYKKSVPVHVLAPAKSRVGELKIEKNLQIGLMNNLLLGLNCL